MRKILIIGFVALLSIVLVYGFSDAGVTGRCDNCHTMHYSQNGGVLTTWGATGPYGALLINDCLGCHSNTTDQVTILTPSGSRIPIVWNTTAYPVGAKGTTTAPLAGGNFYSNTVDANVHNVISTDPDGALSNTPPGTTVALGSQLTCAGQVGCHGDRSQSTNYAAVRNAHHDNVTGTCDGTTVAKSFRWLNGITGVEDSDWEQSANSTDHNGYKGSTDFTTASTISSLCGQCHGNTGAGGFHSALGTGGPPSPWERHPTDVVLTASGGGSTFVTDYTIYNIQTPVAFATPSTSTSAVDLNSIVICLSCHAAHGTDEPDILRWEYNTMNAGQGASSGTGCLRCHQRQR